MKRLTAVILFLLLCTSLEAQRFQRRGFSLGADRDTMAYIIASPFDNWYLTVGGTLQTFIGNELEATGRHNKLNYGGRVELGKWVIPDIAVSLRLMAFNVDGQSKYGLQPFIDYTSDSPNENGYYPFHAHALAVMGFVTLDWTNFLNGYEAGRRIKFHIFTPIGLGMSMLYGTQRNPRGDYEVGDFRRNLELSYMAGIGVEYELTDKVALSAVAELFGSESTWDWSPYDNEYSIFDIMPQISFGARFNLLSSVTKYNRHTKTTSKEKVNHEFIAFGTRTTVSTLNGRIERLNGQIDSIVTMADTRGAMDSTQLAALIAARDSLQRLYDDSEAELISRGPRNMLEELIAINEQENLPATLVYFPLDKYDIDYNGHKRLQNFARKMSRMEDTVEFYIVGAADSATGSKRHNAWLSEKRCMAAYNLLTEEYGVSGNQFILVPLGGITDYDPQENNRMAMIILKTPVTEEIITRWLNRRE